jgi:hypothetical protein
MAARTPDQVPAEFLFRHLTAMGMVVLSTPTVFPAAVEAVCVPWPFLSSSCTPAVSEAVVKTLGMVGLLARYR